MLTELELNAMADSFENIYAKVCERVIAEIGKNIAKTMDLTPAQAKAIQKMHIHGADMGKLDGILKQASGKSFSDLKAMYEYAVKDSYTWARPFYQNRGLTKIPTRFNQSLKQMLNAISQSSGKTLENLSRTTAIGVQTSKGFVPLEKFYKDAVNKGILSVSTGTESYQKAVRKAVQELGGSGLRVQYDSGYSRRLDSAVRQNVLDGMSYIAQESARIHGEAFGADGWELSAHSPCAPDHLPYQGLQFSKAEYEDLQASLARPIGEWNCRHIAYPIILGVSGTANSKEELAEMERYSNEKIEIDGHEYTRYECTQLQRKLETEMRKAQEQRILFKNAGMKDLEREASQRLNQLGNKYKEVSDKAGLPTRAERTRIVQGQLKAKNASEDLVHKFDNFDITEGGKYRVIKAKDEMDYKKQILHEYLNQNKDIKDWLQVWTKPNGYIQAASYKDINNYKRGLSKVYLNSEQKKTVKAMDRLTRNKMSQDTIVYRKVNSEYFENIKTFTGIDTTKWVDKRRLTASGWGTTVKVPKDKKTAEETVKQINALVGQRIDDKAYTSVSMCEDLNYFTHYPVKFEIQMPKGTKGFLTDNYEESEFIAKSGSSIEILGSTVYNDKGDWCIKIFGRLIQK